MNHNDDGNRDFSISPVADVQLPSPKSSIELKKKPSLSERRGMKLNVNELSSMTLPISTEANLEQPQEKQTQVASLNTIPRTTGIELSRRFSERTKKKPNFKLDLNSSDSDNNGKTTNNNPVSDKPKLPGMFANYSKYIDIKKGELKFSGKASLHSKGVDFSSGHSFRISMDELEILDELGRGNYGSVLKVMHKPTNVIMAMKEVRLELDETKFTQILMELDILHKCNSPYIVDFYGAFFSEGAVYMCMEYMDGGSLDKIYGKDHGIQDEESLAYITECIIRGLKELKDVHNIIHRDVKPTNILVNTAGKVKLCDFGVSGNLVASLAKTNIGCQSYMAPERIKTTNPNDSSYSVQSDIWSLGLTILEVACGHYPYPPETYDNIFSQLSAIVEGEPPKLDSTKFSKEAQLFVKSCVNMNPDARPIYASLLNSPWLVKYRGVEPHVAEYVKQRLHEIELENERQGISRTNSGRIRVSNLSLKPANSEKVTDLLKNKVRQPALHRTRLQRNSGNSFASR
jgi:mitogen-activated protein kinase kinase